LFATYYKTACYKSSCELAPALHRYPSKKAHINLRMEECGMFVQYCQCLKPDNIESVRKIVIPNGPFRETIFYCCEDCYRAFFSRPLGSAVRAAG
jgi:hypothetical protein